MTGDTDVTAFGAVGDGETTDTDAIQAAIDDCADGDGGRVVVPAGRYLTGTLRLRSGVTLRLESGATLLGSPDLSDYPVIDEAGRGRGGDNDPRHLLYAGESDGVRIEGDGVIDGNGSAFWDTDNPERLPEAAARDLSESEREYYLTAGERPAPMVDFVDCKDVRVTGVTMRNSPGWTLHFQTSERVRVTDVTIDNPRDGPNTDGVSFTSSRKCFVRGCDIDGGDDAVVLNTIAGLGDLERIVVADCVLASRTCAVKYWSDLDADAQHDCRDLLVSNCVVHDSERAFGLYPDGGVVEGVRFQNCTVETGVAAPNIAERPVHFDTHNWQSKPEIFSPLVRDVTVSDCSFRTPGRLLVTGTEAQFENIRFEDCMIRDTGSQSLDSPAFTEPYPSDTQFAGRVPEARTAPAYVVVADVDGLTVRNIHVAKDDEINQSWDAVRTLRVSDLYASGITGEFEGEKIVSSDDWE
jgi:polygalacturonase